VSYAGALGFDNLVILEGRPYGGCAILCKSAILKCNIDYSYNFNTSRFSILDHFLLSGSLFNHYVVEACVLHNVDNTSDHDPIIVSLDLDVNFVALSQRNITPQVSWARAASNDLEAYSRNLSCLLSDISIPVDAVLCCNLSCNNLEHVSAIRKYADSLSCACTAAAAFAIPHSAYRSQTRQIPGWSERI